MSDFLSFIDLIKSGPDGEIENKFRIEYVEMKDSNWLRPLHIACCYGRVGLVKILIDNKCDINASDKRGYQPIHLACMNGHIDIVKILIDNKCDINASDKYWGYQPIHLACENGHIDIVKILIDNKCDINASNDNGYKPIHSACMNGHIDIVKILIDNKCDINASDKRGYQPIHLACEKGHIDIVKILIDNKCDINASDKIRGYQPIHLASENGHIDIVKILIDNKCDINASNKYVYQPIHLACMNGHINIVKILIDNKCDINASDKIRGYQPIHLACENGHVDIVKILIDNKCDIKSLTKDGKFPINIARQRRHQQIIDIIKTSDDDPIESIVRSLNLQCTVLCDHRFCLKSLKRGKFPKGELIGKGSFGKVIKYKMSNTNREIVIKKTETVSEDKKNIERNINRFSSEIIHKNIVRYFGALEKSGKLYIFTEYISQGSLKDVIDKSGRMEINKVIRYSKQILVGLQFLHSKAIIHRDIKPGNILLDHDETVKLSDFGLSISLQKSLSESIEQADTFCGTINYMAPEVVLNELYDYPADIWSTGATIIHMITGQMPYHNLRPPNLILRIVTTKQIEFTANPPIPETMQSFINDLLTPDQSKRPRATILLNHSIFEELI